MCGICGLIGFNDRSIDLEAVTPILARLETRGPDAVGAYKQGRVVLGQRRLKIIDLSEKAQQPMIDAFLGLSIVYNGAIYNYKELRRELQEMGHRFFSNGDTEVILKAYHQWGPSCVTRFNGMFAFCILHRDSGRLFLARDRLGIKPLYYTQNAEVFGFASTLPALLTLDHVDTRIDPVALNYFLTFHSVVPPPHTMISGIRKLPPANTMVVEPDGRVRTHCYWELNFKSRRDKPCLDEAAWQQQLRDAIEASVRRRLVADVPVGVLLSGGLDSSLLVGLLADAGQYGLNTFSIGFEAAGGETGDEFQYSDLIAEHFGTCHHKIQVSTDRLLPALDQSIHAMSEPMVSHDCIGFYLLSQEVSRHVKVVQSGQGADEVFGGYHWYPPLMESTAPVEDYRRVFFDCDYELYKSIVHADFWHGDLSSALVEEFFHRQGDMAAIDKALKLDTTVMLVDDPVKRVDNMTMAFGLEARVPFLDHLLVELAARIPAELKIRKGGKYILKQVARDLIPADIIDRPKGYFPVPALKYIQDAYLEFVSDTLHSHTARKRNLFDPSYVDLLIREPLDHHTPLRGSRLWQIALLERWLTIHQIQGV